PFSKIGSTPFPRPLSPPSSRFRRKLRRLPVSLPAYWGALGTPSTMNLAWISVGALLLAVTLSCTTAINVGVLSLALALAVGVWLADMSPAAVLEGFPTELLITLVGVTLLFAIAEVNGTLERLTARAVALCRGRAALLPVLFFMLGFVIATIGAGATPASALLAPPAMAAAARAGIPALPMALMAGNGTLAGTLSPFAPTGIVAHGVMERIGLGGVEWQTFAYNAVAHAIVGVAGFLLFGGRRLLAGGANRPVVQAESAAAGPMERKHWLTAAAIVLLIGAVVGFGADVGMVALLLASVLVLLGTVEESKAVQRMPWGVILMVTGVTVLIALLRETEGLALITGAIAAVSSPATIEAVVAFGAG